MMERGKLPIAVMLLMGLAVPSLASAQQTFDDKLPVFGAVPFARPKPVSVQPSVAQPVVAKCAKPNSPPIPRNIGSWITTNDYPARALREERGGRVTFRIIVNTLGMPQKVVILSAAYADLGAATAALLMRRARFIPAVRKCIKVRSHFEGAMTWVVPQ